MKGKKPHYAWWIMISCCALELVCLGFMCNSIGIFIGPITEDLGVTVGAFSFYLMSRQLAMTVSLPLAGRVISKANIRLALFYAVAVFAGMYLVLTQVYSIKIWYVAGIVQGMALGFFAYLPIPILINNWFEKKVGFVLGFTSAFTGVGGVVFNPIGVWIIQNYGWRTGFIVLGLSAGIIVLPFLLFVVRLKPSDLGLQPYGKDEAIPATAQAQELSGITAANAIRTVPFYCMMLVGGLLAFAYQMNAHLPRYIDSIGYPPFVGGTIASTVMIGVIISKIALGFLNDRFGIKAASETGVILGMLAMVFILFGKSHIVIFYIGAFLYGFGIATLTMAVPLLVRTIFGSVDYGRIYSYITIPQAFLGAIGVYIFGFLYDSLESYELNIIIAGICYILCFILIEKALQKDAFRKYNN